MKKIIAIVLFAALLIPSGLSFSQDNIYGDYLIYSLEKRVSLDLEGAQLVDVLKMLSQQTKLNFVSTEAVQDRQLTLYIENVPLKEAMNIIFKANGLAYDFYPDSNIFVVKEMGKPTLELMTKVYQLQYVRSVSTKMDREMEERMAEGSAEDDVGITTAVERVLSEAGKVTEDPITNSLVVTDVPSQFPMIDEVIHRLDIPPQRVMIEVEMLDVSKSYLDEIGFNWSGNFGRYQGPSRVTAFPYLGTAKGKLPSDHGASIGAVTTGGTTTFQWGILDFSGLTVTLDLLKQCSSTKFLARPKILTLSNETAEVNLTVDQAIGATTTIDEGERTTDIERAETGTKLRVTPQVNPYTDEITLYVEVFNRNATPSGISFAEDAQITGSVLNVEERGTKSMVRLQEGETLFIGGLIRKSDVRTEKKVPFLGDIPFIGALFRHKATGPEGGSNLESELMIFLTPHIIEDKPYLAKKTKGPIYREQVDCVKRDSVRLALDNFGM